MGQSFHPPHLPTGPTGTGYLDELSHQVRTMNTIVEALQTSDLPRPLLVSLGDTCERVSQRIQYLLRWGDA